MDNRFDKLSAEEKRGVLSKPHIIIEAPAGFGKTHTISECVKLLPDNQCQLILTHTHAGIASLQQKMKDNGVPKHKYTIETITGIAQRIALSFLLKEPSYSQDDTKNYFPYIVKTASKLMDSSLIKGLFSCNFNGLFVDEYQDCTADMHEFIMKFSNLFPIRILGDELQGIFSFRNNSTVKFEQLVDFEKYELSIPWRWRVNDNNQKLGNWIIRARELLTNIDSPVRIPFEDYDEYGVKCYGNLTHSEKIKLVKQLLLEAEKDKKSILILTSTFQNANKRALIKAIIDQKNLISLLEPFDEQSYYSVTSKIDSIVENKEPESFNIRELLKELSFTSKSIDAWFNKGGNVICKRQKTPHCTTLPVMMTEMQNSPSYKNIYDFLIYYRFDIKNKCLRQHLFKQVVHSLELANHNKITAFEAMTQLKNRERRMGRKADIANIGTTLLTKGLEYDVVVIVNAEEIKDRSNFYVAISRACKQLYILSSKDKIFVT